MRKQMIGVILMTALTGAASVLALRPAPAHADTASVTIVDQDGNVDPVAGLSRTVTVTGETTATTWLFIKYRPADGSACAATADADPGVVLGELNGEVLGGGQFSHSITWTFPTPTTLMVCIWLPPWSTGGVDTPTSPTTQIISIRPENGTVTATATPSTSATTAATTVTVAGRSDIQVIVLATYRPAGGPPCAASYTADPGTTFVESMTAAGGSFSLVNTIPFPQGSWVICSWLNTIDYNGPTTESGKATFSGPTTTQFTVGTPVSTPPRSVSPPITRLATKIHSTFPSAAHRLRLTVSSRISATRTATGTCWLQEAVAGRWRTVGAHAPVMPRGACVVSARFARPGRKRLRIDFHPAGAFKESVSAASWVSVTRA